MPIINMTGGEGMPYNLTGIVSSENILEFIQGVNNLTGQTFMLGILLAGFVIMFVSMQYAGTKESLVASGFITTVLAMFFFALEFIKGSMLTIIIIVFVIIFVVGINKKG